FRVGLERLEGTVGRAADADVAGVAETAFLEAAADGSHRPLDRVHRAELVGVDDVPNVGLVGDRGVGADAAGGAAADVLDELAAGARPLHGVGTHRPADGPVDAL